MKDPLNPLDPETLAAARKARGLSRVSLAVLASTDHSTIFRIEAGQDPRVTMTWAPIVRALQAVPLKAIAA